MVLKTIFYNLILLLPLLTFLSLLFSGSFFGIFGAMSLCFGNMLFVVLFSIYLFFYFSFEFGLSELLWVWVEVDKNLIMFSIRYDSLTATMFIVVSLVSFCVHFYSFVYMFTEPYIVRFLSYLSLFTFFMLILVSAGNLLTLFLGWEGVGVCSYLLISFWVTRIQAGKAATKAFLINKIGDLFFLSGIALVFLVFNTLEFDVLQLLVPYCASEVVELITIFFVIGAIGKSAQIGLHTWLPDAMEGPTPVSALIHAATMVTAGIFLLLRCSVFLEHSPRILWFITLWGGLTVLIAGLIGMAQNDIKKIIAYSTCSQLGYMFLALGLVINHASLFHLFNHAFFKALLFLGAGSVIHFLNGEQDTRRMGALAKLTPFIYIVMLLASLSLMGFPFLAGFYSKDIILEISLIKTWVHGHFIYWLVVVGAVLTVIYSFRLLERVFLADYSGFKSVLFNATRITNLEIVVLAFLGVLSLVSGYFFKDLFTGLGSFYFNNFFIIQKEAYNTLVEVEFLAKEIKMLPCFFSFIAFEIESRFYECKWYFNEIINNYLVLPNLFLGRFIFEQYEKNLLEANGPLFLYNTFKKINT